MKTARRSFSAVLLTALAITGAYSVAADAASPAAPKYCAPVVEPGPGAAGVVPVKGATGCRYSTGVHAASPAATVMPSGVVFVGMETGGVLRSMDGGKHWTKIVVAPTNGDQGGSHGFTVVDKRTNRLYYVTSSQVASCKGTVFAGGVIQWTDDLGKTWHGKTVSCQTYDWGRMAIGPAPKGNKYPSALYFFGVAKRLIGGERLVYRSLDGAKTWQLMKNLASATTEAGAGVVAPDGTIYFDYPEFIGFDPTRVANTTYPFQPQNLCRQMIAVSQDYGVTWRQQPVTGSQACFMLSGSQRVAVDRAGTVYTFWLDDFDGKLYLQYSKDKARTWSKRVMVQPSGSTHSINQATIVAAEPGHVVISSQGTAGPSNPRLAFVPLKNGEDVRTYMQETFNATAAAPRFQTARFDPPNDPTYPGGDGGSEFETSSAINDSGVPWTAFTRADGFTWAGTITRKR